MSARSARQLFSFISLLRTLSLSLLLPVSSPTVTAQRPQAELGLARRSSPIMFGGLVPSIFYDMPDFRNVVAADLGDILPGKAIIGDTVWYDRNSDGVRNLGEPGTAGVQVCATPTSGAAICDTTDSNGEYLIEVPAGTYNITPVNPPAGATATTPVPHGPVTVSPGDQHLDADFGFFPLGATIGGYIWDDTDGNGQQDAGEEGIAGVMVCLYSYDYPSPTPLACTYTDANGNYSFPDLPDYTYTVNPSKSGYSFTPPLHTVTVPPDAHDRNFIGTPPEIELIGLEVTQAIQDLNNSVVLIQGKTHFCACSRSQHIGCNSERCDCTIDW